MIPEPLLDIFTLIAIQIFVINREEMDPDDYCKILESLVDSLQNLTPLEQKEIIQAFEKTSIIFGRDSVVSETKMFLDQLSHELKNI